MWRSKKFVLAALVIAVVLVGSTAGIVLAADNGDGSQPKTLLARVAEKLGINQQELEDAFAQAQSEMRDEALDSYLQNLVAQGKITQEEADQYKAWWQARPDMEPFRQQLREWQQAKPGMPPELKEWQQAEPDIPAGIGFPGHGKFHGMRGMRGFGGPCAPTQ